MKRLILTACCLVLFTSLIQAQNILMVVSSYGKLQGEARPGFEFDEFSQAYLVFRNNGLTIDIASPKGGKVEADKYNSEKIYNQLLIADKKAMKALERTIPTAEVDADKYDAIYIVGGKGAMFDLPFDPALQDIILNLYLRDGTVISSVCHGPAAFANIKHEGKFIIEGIEVTSFTNQEESLFGKKWVQEFPFKLEDKLVQRGATFKELDFMLSNVTVSGKFITGQNPFSTVKSAEEVVKALGLKSVASENYPDVKSIYLVADILNGNKSLEKAKAELSNEASLFDIPLIAVYGYYKMLAAGDDTEKLEQGAQITELTEGKFFDENLQMYLAQSYVTLDKKEKARKILNDLVSRDMLVKQANDMLKSID